MNRPTHAVDNVWIARMDELDKEQIMLTTSDLWLPSAETSLCGAVGGHEEPNANGKGALASVPSAAGGVNETTEPTLHSTLFSLSCSLYHTLTL